VERGAELMISWKCSVDHCSVWIYVFTGSIAVVLSQLSEESCGNYIVLCTLGRNSSSQFLEDRDSVVNSGRLWWSCIA
jgi:hypothetical protein